MNNFILSCKNISLTLNQVPIIENINFSLYPGEFHLLMGENGAGKTTLANILSGVYPFKSYSGTIIFNQQELRLTTPRDAIKKKISTIPKKEFNLQIIFSKSIMYLLILHGWLMNVVLLPNAK